VGREREYVNPNLSWLLPWLSLCFLFIPSATSYIIYMLSLSKLELHGGAGDDHYSDGPCLYRPNCGKLQVCSIVSGKHLSSFINPGSCGPAILCSLDACVCWKLLYFLLVLPSTSTWRNGACLLHHQNGILMYQKRINMLLYG
jgi:hypothetical protein